MNTASQQTEIRIHKTTKKSSHGRLYIMQSTLPSMYSNQPHPQIIHQHQHSRRKKIIKNKIE